MMSAAVLMVSSPLQAAMEPDTAPIAATAATRSASYWLGNDRARYPELLRQVYLQREQRLLWFGSTQASNARHELRWQLLELALAGAPERVANWLREVSHTDDQGTLQSDSVFTDAFIGLMLLRQELASVPFQQAMSLEPLDSLPLEAVAGIAEGLIVATGADLWEQLNRLQGVPERVQRNRQQISRLLAEAMVYWPLLGDGPLLRPGEHSERVTVIRQQLARLDYLEDELSASPEPEAYDRRLVAEVERFQAAHGLKVDGIVGSQTRHWLNTSPLVRARLLARNQLRMQLFQPYRMEHQVVVNVPAFQLALYRQGAPVLQSRVIVGRNSRPTPLLSSEISSVVVNPTWNVPRSILRKDILPKLRRDPGYLLRSHFKLIRYDGQPVDVTDDSWQSVLYQPGVPFRLQQQPGADNALGRYKFHFDNPYAVYLHDTASPGLYAEAERGLSSGCIRVEQAERLANYLFQQAGYSAEYTGSLLTNGATRWLPLPNTVPVSTVYWTAWVDASGQLQYRNDIYHLDMPVWRQSFPLVSLVDEVFQS